MPFKSEAQRKWMYANKPAMAKRWQKHTPKGEKLPEKVAAKCKIPPQYLSKLDLPAAKKRREEKKEAADLGDAAVALGVTGAVSLPIIAALAYNRKMKKKTMEERLHDVEMARMEGIYPLDKTAAVNLDKVRHMLVKNFANQVDDVIKTMRKAQPSERINAVVQRNLDTMKRHPRAVAHSMDPEGAWEMQLHGGMDAYQQMMQTRLADPKFQGILSELNKTKAPNPAIKADIQKFLPFDDPGMLSTEQLAKLVNPSKAKWPGLLALGIGAPLAGAGVTGGILAGMRPDPTIQRKRDSLQALYAAQQRQRAW